MTKGYNEEVHNFFAQQYTDIIFSFFHISLAENGGQPEVNIQKTIEASGTIKCL